MYKVRYSKGALKDFDRLSKQIRERINKAIKNKLITNPEIHTQPLSDYLKGYRKLRVGDYRVICKIENKELIVLVVAMGHRRKIYQMLRRLVKKT